jgi:methionyl-tRNA synthetase
MIETNFGGKIPEPGEIESRDGELRKYSSETIDLYRKNFDSLQISKAIDNVWELISVVNKYLVANEPWAMAGDDSKKERLGTVLYCSAESLRIIAILLSPILPDGTKTIFKQLGISEAIEDQRIPSLTWGGLAQGSSIGKIKAVYPRLDAKEFMARVEEKKQERETTTLPEVKAVEASVRKKTIDIGDFGKVEMRVGKIISAEAIPKSKKLLKIRVDIGSEVRQVVAGIGQEYSVDVLPGRLVAVVTNLKPAKLMGVESNGMLVAASNEGKPVLATFTEPVRLGARLK